MPAKQKSIRALVIPIDTSVLQNTCRSTQYSCALCLPTYKRNSESLQHSSKHVILLCIAELILWTIEWDVFIAPRRTGDGRDCYSKNERDPFF